MAENTARSAGSTSEGHGRSAWIVLGLAVLTSGLTGPGQTIGVSVFIDSFVDDLGLTRSQVSTAYLIGTLTASTMLPTVGRLVDRRGVRLVQMAIAIGFAVALVNMSFVNGLVWLTVGFVGIRLLGQGSLSLVATVTVSLRFLRNRGTALGVFSTASAGLMAVVPILLGAAIDAYGWRIAWRVAAGVVLVTVFSIAFFGLRSLPTGTHGRSADAGTAEDAVDDGSYTRAQALRTRGFWLLASVSATTSMLITALNFHQIDLLTDAGLSESAARALFIPQVIGSTIAGLLVGYLADRIGTRFLPAATMVLLIGAHVLGAIVAPGVSVLAYTIALGATGGAARTVSSTLLPAWFGTTHLGSIQGSMTLVAVGASALGPVTLAVAEAGFDSYPASILTLAAIPTAVLVFSLGKVDV